MTEIWNLSTLCRCCHSDGCFKKLNLPYQSENNVEIYESMLQEALGIKVFQTTIEQASYMICDDCIKRLRDAVQFRLQVLACEQKFKEYCTNEQFQVKTEVESNGADICDIDGDEDMQRGDDDSQKDDEQMHSVPVKEEKRINETAYEDDSSFDEALPSTSSSSNDIHPTILDGSFFEIIPNQSQTSSVVALCKKCSPNRVEIKGNRKCTSNFKTHLKRKHGSDTVLEYEAYVKSKRCKIIGSFVPECEESVSNKRPGMRDESVELSPQSQTSNLALYTQSDFDRDFVKYFISSMVSLSSVDDPYFRQLLQRSNPTLQIMSRRFLGMNITRSFIQGQNWIKQELAETTHVFMTVDVWSGSQMSFIGVIAHWLDRHTLKRTSRALACESFKRTESHNTVYKMLCEITEAFRLRHSKQVHTYVLRNESNLVKAFKSFGIYPSNISRELTWLSCAESSSHTEELDSDTTEINKTSIVDYLEQHLTHKLKCATHILNECAIDASEVLEDQDTELSKIHYQTLEKCNILWKASSRLPSGQTIRYILGHVLPRPNSIKWNSIYEALKEIYNMKDKYTLINKALNLKNDISETEFLYINEYLTCTQPIADALDILQGENATYYGILFPTILSLKKKLVRLLGQGDTFMYCKELVKAYLVSVESKFKDYLTISSERAENAALAAITHPKYKKLKWTSLVEQSQFLRIKNLLIKEISRNIPTENSKEIPLSRSKEDEYFESDSSSDSERITNEPISKAELIVSHYFAEESKDLSLLDNHVMIKKMFLKYNSPLPSSASVQQMFSNKTINCININDHSEMFQRRLVLKMNLID
ncbi:unnamed protein product [Arctia plantaginis]|uniref:ZAD domain-containing protein n=1 Tax=Arctia plantaginis TaxID=874455 RepID=A0A8S0ZPU4_ARCPL|nr:unnamed protein product [Arctia plantaginis]